MVARWWRRYFRATLTLPGILNLIFRSMNTELEINYSRASVLAAGREERPLHLELALAAKKD